MPVTSFLEPTTGPRHTALTADASEYTRYLKMSATVAPYINNGVNAAPTLGWKSNEVALNARVVVPVFGLLRSFIPNRG